MDGLILGGDGQGPIWKRLVRNVVRMVDEGTMPDGSRLPPSRVLARDLGVNRSTVCRAYEELAALGYLASRSGSYSTIRARTRLVPQSRAVRPLLDWDALSAPGVARAYKEAASLPRAVRPQDGWIDFGSLAADPSLSPVTEYTKCLRRVLSGNLPAGDNLRYGGQALLAYGDPAGFPALRDTLARRMHRHGIRATAEDVLITQGAQQALDLVLRLVARPGASVVVEAPTYGLLLPILRLYDLRPIEIPMRSEGMDLDLLEKTLGSEHPVLLYTIPTFHNPTGITTSQAHRERLLALCEKHSLPILEDGYEEEMKYRGRQVLPIKSMDARGLVIYAGTFSKVLFPGLRVGWLTAERECLHRLAMVTRVTSLSGNHLPQAALELFCHEGGYDRYLKKVHARFRTRMTALLEGLQRHCGRTAAEWSRPNGGSVAWVRIPRSRGQDEKRLLEEAGKAHVAITPGSVFFATPPREIGFRISISQVDVSQIDEGCRRLAKVLAALSHPQPTTKAARPKRRTES